MIPSPRLTVSLLTASLLMHCDAQERRGHSDASVVPADSSSEGDAQATLDAGFDAARRDAGRDGATRDAEARDASIRDGAPGDGRSDMARPEFGFPERHSPQTCRPFRRPASSSSVELVAPFPNLPGIPLPLGLFQAPGDPTRWFVLDQRGRIVTFDHDPEAATLHVFADLTALVNADPNEAGLLGMAFDPGFVTSGMVYVSYTGYGGPIDLTSHVSRFFSRDGGATLDLGSEERLLSLVQPAANHNGGNIAFGSDGLLYAGFGDGGPGNDPSGFGQNPDVLFGKILRLDVSASGGYSIPPTNPFASGGGRAEIYALGFRNPWRFSFDRVTGDLWLGDVGQSAREEIDRVELGGNYGWDAREGTRCFTRATCTTPGLIDPVVEYDRLIGRTVVGGYVYRGRAIPSLVGTYVFADFYTGQIFTIEYDVTTGVPRTEPLVLAPGKVSSFGEGVDGELYVTLYDKRRILKLAPSSLPDAGDGPQPSVPTRLSETGCIDPGDPGRFAASVLPYGVRSPLWADGADKTRGMALPEGSRIRIESDGDWTLPEGSVLMKTFAIDGRRLETRLLIHHDDGDWAGYAYAWTADQTDAVLVEGSTVVEGAGRSWYVPSRSECPMCHTVAAGRTLGLETAQLNADFEYPNGAIVNQLVQLSHIALFETPPPLPPSSLPALPAPDQTGPVAGRARSYLHANCSMCHRPEGGGLGNMDLRYDAALAGMNACDVLPGNGTLGVTDARLLAPGLPEKSMLSLRMHASGAPRMPPVASSLVDSAGTRVVDDWITSLGTCP